MRVYVFGNVGSHLLNIENVDHGRQFVSLILRVIGVCATG